MAIEYLDKGWMGGCDSVNFCGHLGLAFSCDPSLGTGWKEGRVHMILTCPGATLRQPGRTINLDLDIPAA